MNRAILNNCDSEGNNLHHVKVSHPITGEVFFDYIIKENNNDRSVTIITKSEDRENKMKKYLFRDNHNGYEITYHPFEIDHPLTQEKAEEMMLSTNPAARRKGGSVKDLLIAAYNLGWEFKEEAPHYKPEENHLRCIHGDKNKWDIDPLPHDMYSLEIIEGISGNY